LRRSGRVGSLVTVGYELMNSTREALLDGTLTFLIADPARSLIVIKPASAGGSASLRPFG